MNLHDHPALAGLTVLERSWLSSNNVLVHPKGDETGATLIDSGHATHAEQTVALVTNSLQGRALARIVNTHLHSDHCGGNAALQRAFGADVFVPPGQAEAVRIWDAQALSYEPTGQRCERFTLHGVLSPGELLHAGGRQFEVLAAPGHDPHSVLLFDRASGLLVSADALWENGFGVVFPELEGESAFDDVAAVLDMIEQLPVTLVVPGHGSVFTDVPAALSRARSRLAAFRANPMRHARHAAKVLLSYHLMEEHSATLAHLREWAERTPIFLSVWSQVGSYEAETPSEWCDLLVNELVTGGVARRVGESVVVA